MGTGSPEAFVSALSTQYAALSRQEKSLALASSRQSLIFKDGVSVHQILNNQPRVVVEDVSLSANAEKLKGLNKPGNPHSLSSHLVADKKYLQ